MRNARRAERDPHTILQQIRDRIPDSDLRGDTLEMPCPVHGGHGRDDQDVKLHIKDDGGIAPVCYSRHCAAKDIAAAIETLTGIEINPRPPTRDYTKDAPVAIYDHPDGTPREAYQRRVPAYGNCVWRYKGGGVCQDKTAHKHPWVLPKGIGIAGCLVKLWPPKPESAQENGRGLAVVVEGEKVAAAVQAAGYVGVSYISGAHSAGLADYGQLAGFDVIVSPDNDDEGLEAAEVAAGMAAAAGAKSVRVMPPIGGEKGADLADIPVTDRVIAISAARLLPEWSPPSSPVAPAAAAAADVIPYPTAPIIPTTPPAEPYPLHSLPESLLRVVEAIEQAAGVPPNIASIAVLSSVAFAVSPITEIEEDGSWVSPAMFFMAISDTGQRKSTAFKYAHRGHKNASDALVRRYNEAKAAHKKREFEARKEKKRIEPPNPVDGQPVMSSSDTTLEAIYGKLAKTRPSAAIYADDATSQFSGWVTGKTILGKTLTGLSVLWDSGDFDLDRTSDGGKDYHGQNRCFNIALGIQIQPALDLLTHPAAATGWGPRVLPCLADHTRYPAGQPTEESKAEIARFGALIHAIRWLGDDGLEWTDSEGHIKDLRRRRMALDDSAMDLLHEYYVRGYDDMPEGEGLLPGFRARRGQQARRLAGNMAMFQEYANQWDALADKGSDRPALFHQQNANRIMPHPLVIGADWIAMTIEITDWHESEIRRIDAVGGTEFTDACRKVVSYIQRLAADPPLSNGQPCAWARWDGDRFSIAASKLKRIGGRFAKDAEFHAAVIKYLLEFKHILTEPETGRLILNPAHNPA